MKNLPTHSLEIDGLADILAKLPTIGHIAKAKSGLIYLNVDDRYIHDVFPLLSYTKAQKPNYFDYDTDAIGAHISIVYPEENFLFHALDEGGRHSFSVEGLVYTELLNHRYFALKIQAPTLIVLRQRAGLRKKLCFKNYSIDLHMTIGVEIS